MIEKKMKIIFYLTLLILLTSSVTKAQLPLHRNKLYEVGNENGKPSHYVKGDMWWFSGLINHSDSLLCSNIRTDSNRFYFGIGKKGELEVFYNEEEDNSLDGSRHFFGTWKIINSNVIEFKIDDFQKCNGQYKYTLLNKNSNFLLTKVNSSK